MIKIEAEATRFILWLWGLTFSEYLKPEEKSLVHDLMKDPHNKEKILKIKPFTGTLINWDSLERTETYALSFRSAHPIFPLDYISGKPCWSFFQGEEGDRQLFIEKPLNPYFSDGQTVQTFHGVGTVRASCSCNGSLFYAIEIHAKPLNPSFILIANPLCVWKNKP